MRRIVHDLGRRYPDLLCLLLLFAVSGCADRPRSSDEAGRLLATALGAENTGDLRLPIPLIELRAQRPASVATEFGARESIAPAEVRYFGKRQNGSDPVDPDTDVVGYEVSWLAVSDSVGRTAWRSLLARVNDVVATRASCLLYPKPSAAPSIGRRTEVVRWTWREGRVDLLLVHSDSIPQGNGTWAPLQSELRLIYRIDTSAYMFFENQSQRVTCP